MGHEPLLRPEEVSGVLSSDDPPGAAVEAQPQPYSLREPLAIPPASQERAQAKLERIVEALGSLLRSTAGREVEVTLDAMQQMRAGAALDTVASPVWVLPLAAGSAGGLALLLPAALALPLVDLWLGGPGGKAEPRPPTAVESRVLERWLASWAETLRRRVGIEAQATSVLVGEIPRSVAASDEPLAVGLLRLRWSEQGGDRSALLLVAPALLLDEAGPLPRPDALGPLAEPLAGVPVAVRVVLRAGRVSVADLLELEPEKILRFDVAEDAPFEVRVEGEVCLRGRLERAPDKTVLSVVWRRGAAKNAGARVKPEEGERP